MPTAEDRERNMENAIQAAINCFETVGISNCTREMIAEKSGLSTRSLQRYFGTLNNLIKEATKRYSQNFNERYEEMFHSYSVEGRDGLTQLEFALRMHVYLFQPNMPSVIVMQEIDNYWTRLDEVPYELLSPYIETKRHGQKRMKYSFVYGLLEEGIEDGSIRADLDLNLTYLWISSSFTGMLYRIGREPELYNNNEDNISAKEIINGYVAAVLDAIRS